jgi:hypothetical protein
MMQNKAAAGEKKTYSMWVCPNCGKTVHLDRVYCDCRADLLQACISTSENTPEIDHCNFETANLSCADCPEDCAWCASFGEPRTKKNGFGGKNCRYRSDISRCYCCQAQVKLANKITEEMNFSGLLTTAEMMRKMADYIRTKREEPVLARIRQNRERAG